MAIELGKTDQIYTTGVITPVQTDFAASIGFRYGEENETAAGSIIRTATLYHFDPVMIIAAEQYIINKNVCVKAICPFNWRRNPVVVRNEALRRKPWNCIFLFSTLCSVQPSINLKQSTWKEGSKCRRKRQSWQPSCRTSQLRWKEWERRNQILAFRLYHLVEYYDFRKIFNVMSVRYHCLIYWYHKLLVCLKQHM